MNDRFKFRVWYKLYNGYVEKRDHLVLLSDGILCEYDGIEIDSDNYIIEQCTGLKDKNGNLIYEGDVVKYYWETKTKTGFISWNDDFSGFYVINKEEHCMESPHCLMYVVDTKNIEIIGNIHEQAEQLKQLELLVNNVFK